MPDKFVKIAAYNTPIEANFAKNLLAEEGIESYLDNDVTLSMIGYYNVAVGGVKLFVYDFDADRARGILARGQERQPSGETRHELAAYPGGRCPKCGAKLEPGFETCWSCGESLEAKPVDVHKLAKPVAEPAPVPEIKCPKCGAELEPGFEACWSCGEPLEKDDLDALEQRAATFPALAAEEKPQTRPQAARMQIIEEADDLAKKAWFAAGLGLVFCPVIFHIYSAFLIAIILVNGFPLSRRGARRLWFATVLDLVVFAVMGLIVWRNLS